MSGSGQGRTRFPVRLCAITLVLTAATLGWAGWNEYAGHQDADGLRSRSVRVHELRGIILRLDEVLTMSARMAAATGDPQWEVRYRQHEPELDAAIKEVIALTAGVSAVRRSVETDIANARLVEMEYTAFALIREHQAEAARALLFSRAYDEQKALYSEGMNASLSEVRIWLDERLQESRRRAVASTIGTGIMFLLALGAWIVLITRLRRTQAELIGARDEALGASRLKAEFLANMSHEIRTPMNGVIGMTSMLLDTPLTPTQRDCAETIRASGETLLALISDILDFSKIEAGKLTIETCAFDVSDLLHRAVMLHAHGAQSKGLELVACVDPSLPARLLGDPERIGQIISNFVSNAVKFTEGGEVVVRLAAAAGPDPDGDRRMRVKLTVTDTGVGIPQAIQARLFQPFAQADGSTSRRYGGTGLGLAISRQLVSMMNGEIGVESRVGAGSTFWFTLLLGRPEEPEIDAGSPVAIDPAGFRLLVVDDNASSREELEVQARAWSPRVTSAASGSAALVLLREAAAAGDPFTIAVVDMQMPEMDGSALARAIKNSPDTPPVRLFLLTSLGHRLDSDTMEAAGIETCLIKPVKPSLLCACLSATAPAGEFGVRDLGGERPEAPPAADERPSSLLSLRILLADDNAVNQKVALGQLRKLGYHADVVANGQQAIDRVARIDYDVILMDCQMPEMDGFEATRRIRRQEQSTSDVPAAHRVWIIAMTANAMDGDRELCLTAGMDDYVRKPSRLSDLAGALGRCPAAAIAKRVAWEPQAISRH